MNIVSHDATSNLTSLTMYTMLRDSLDSGSILVLQGGKIRLAKTSITGMYQLSTRLGDSVEVGKPLPLIDLIAVLATVLKVKGSHAL